jgi:hypothetical protein
MMIGFFFYFRRERTATIQKKKSKTSKKAGSHAGKTGRVCILISRKNVSAFHCYRHKYIRAEITVFIFRRLCRGECNGMKGILCAQQE